MRDLTRAVSFCDNPSLVCDAYPELRGGLHGDKSPSQVFDNSKIKRFVPAISRQPHSRRASVNPSPGSKPTQKEWQLTKPPTAAGTR
jgi:hypothetical protein